MPQYSASVNQMIGDRLMLYMPIVGAVDPEWFLNIAGTGVDTGPQCFPTVPSGFNANRYYYPGLSRSYFLASYGETPTHRELQYATQDIPSAQLAVRPAINPEVLARWQMVLGMPADPRTLH